LNPKLAKYFLKEEDTDEDTHRNLVINIRRNYHSNKISNRLFGRIPNLTRVDYLNISYYQLPMEGVVGISNISSKLQDLQILLLKSKLNDSIFRRIVSKRKPTVFDIYTMVQYDYKKLPKIYHREISRKEELRRHYVNKANKIFPNFFPEYSSGKPLLSPSSKYSPNSACYKEWICDSTVSIPTWKCTVNNPKTTFSGTRSP
jgi:hypothetical protein